ncbi:hypothetical protein [Streptomyces poonensis]|uniref:Uncharacterized protein n=1 Tax=Streptomyces poonensis TaxID=68255 RepID=A0A918PLC5_9ACTN|nr:hypothetical protein [Streptomyces poonensis]GGZ12820.1 hypothetical protein GCM10010365_35650 [Streptomyces poonensis]GLJ91980.1 hypothetical protein GCM10017589_45880 [Streptomyces poonensis]
MPGTVLLLAASPAGKGCLVDAASVLPVLAAVAPPVLAGAETANVVELADPLDPQAVLTRLRAAAGTPGPLTVFLAGQLQLDRRQHLPHLALARTTPATVRYTGFPWHWFREELRLRPPGTTTLLADLHADAETWQQLRSLSLDAGPAVAVYGRIAPPPSRRSVAQPLYMKTVATILRSGHRPPPAELHQQALTRIASKGPGTYGDVVLSYEGTAQGGRVGAFGAAGMGAGAGAGAVPGAGASGLSPAPAASAGPVPPAAPGASGASAMPAGPAAPAPSYGSAGPLPASPASPASPSSPPPPSLPSLPPLPAEPPTVGGPAPDDDPHAAISAAVQAERHDEADALAARHEEAARHAHGAASEQALHWAEVRADLAMFAGDAARSCRTWLAVATARLAAGEAPDAPAVETAVDRAHHQWGRVDDAAWAREIGPALLEVRQRVPGRRAGALRHVQRRLARLEGETRELRPVQRVQQVAG